VDSKRTRQFAAFVLWLVTAIPSWATSSALDPTFGVNGFVSTNLVRGVKMAALHGAVLQSDGKLVVAGSASNSPDGFGVARLNLDGTPDSEFNGTGQANAPFGFDRYSSASAVALQADGKIVAAGYHGFGPDNVVALARFLPNGTLDPTFHGSGTVTTTVPGTDAGANAIVVQADGKIVVAASGTAGAAVIRYNADGSLDTSFGAAGTGIVLLKALDSGIVSVRGLALQPDGKLVGSGTGRPVAGAPSTFVTFRLTGAGTQDWEFSRTGIVYTTFNGQDCDARAVALQPDGRIVVAGASGQHIAVLRYNADGMLDASFGSNGTVITAISPFGDSGSAVAILPDGRIVVGGTASDQLTYFVTYIVLARYSANGALDASLAGTGRVEAGLPSLFSSTSSGEFVAVQSDGGVIVGGSNGEVGGAFRYIEDGSLDLAFGTSGRVVASGASSDWLYTLAITSDGKLLAAGSSDGSFAVAAYTADGTFAWSRIIEGYGFGTAGRAVLEQSDGKIVIAGSSDIAISVIRLASDGTLDATFNGTGRVDTPMGPGSIFGVGAALQPDGKIVVAGRRRNFPDDDFALVRYNTDGTLDSAFGAGGTVTTPIGVGDDRAAALAMQSDGKIVVAGTTFDGARFRLAVVRYLTDGSLDPSFGIGGKATLAIASMDGEAHAVAIQADGRIVLAGKAMATVTLFVVARFTADGSPDSSFGSGGVVLTDTGAVYGDGASAMALLADGRILVSGSGTQAGATSFALARYLPNGSLDSTFGIAGQLHVVAPGNPDVTPTGFALQGGNRAVLGGTIRNDSLDFFLVRIFADDTIPPDTALLATPGPTSIPSVSFSFTGTDAGGTDVASFECSLDATPFAICTSPALYAGLSLGPHVFDVRARDGAGNVDPTPASHTWNVVPGPQTITFAELPSRILSASPFTVSATGGDSGNPVVFSSLTPGICTTSGTNGTTVTLLAIGTCSVAADQAASSLYLAAAQVARSFEVFASGSTLTVTRSGSGSGRVTSSPLGIDCAQQCDWTFVASSAVTLTALPDSGSLFLGWSGDCSGTGQCSVQMDAAKNVTAAFFDAAEAAKTPRLINISTRGQVQTGFDVMIGGFVIGGSSPKTVVIRAIGPSLTNYGVPGALANPQLQLVSSSDQVVIASNDDWVNAANAFALQATGFAPSSPLESAIYITLQPGAYTGIVSGAGGSTGVGLVEVYELDNPQVPLINISTRGRVGNGFDVMIGGFVVSGDAPQTVVVRAIGPSLTSYGIAGALANPQLQLFRSSDQTMIASNDDWGSGPYTAQVQASGFAPSNPLESAIYITLDPGAYTAIVSGVNGGTGVGLVEVYKAP
jgi:uncharacterized delta-60 repeat protein